jgi:hypothetical protein
MIADNVVQQIRQLLAQGELSQRKIARVVGVSRGTVSAIALGRRPDYPSGGAPYRRDPAQAETLLWGPGPMQRCPGCGGMVYMPCLACRIRAMKDEARRR